MKTKHGTRFALSAALITLTAGGGVVTANDEEGIPNGACCLPDNVCVDTSDVLCADAGGDFLGDGSMCIAFNPRNPGSFTLRNHPDGNQAPPPYGMRLDELFDVTPGHDKFSFDFEAPGALMTLDFDGTMVHIHGTAFGGLDAGDDYDPAWTSMIEIDFTYAMTTNAPGDDDLIVLDPDTPNSGTVTWLATGEVIDLYDYTNSDPFTFRLGDEDDDGGHRGFDGTSGWGWLAIGMPGNHVVGNDWLFTVSPSCPPLGACCLLDGTCEVVPQRVCKDARGEYMGDDTTCDTCVMEGACCLPDGTCIVTTAEECVAQSGAYLGDNVSCDDANCEAPGACCLPDGSCDSATESECTAQGGIFQGEGVDCADVVCSDPGACCVNDDCVIATADECLDMGGDYQGDGTACAPGSPTEPGIHTLRNHPDGNAAPPGYGLRLDELFDVTADHDIFTFDFEAPGAMMQLEYDGTTIRIYGTAFGGLDAGDGYDPAHTSMVELDFTYDMSATADGDDDLVAPIPDTPNTGTLTWLATGEVFQLFDYANDSDPFTFRLGDEDDDDGHRGFDGISGWGWLAVGSPDGHTNAMDWIFTTVSSCPTDDETGACCLDDDDDCVHVTKNECIAMDGDYQGDNTWCDDVECDDDDNDGACCLDDGSCVEVDKDECQDLGGDFDDDEECDDVECDDDDDEGACCLDDGSCVEVDKDECQDLNGDFNEDDECDDVECDDDETGACCLDDDDDCVHVTKNECIAMDGDYQGDNTWCDDVECDDDDNEGACCLDDGSCVEVDKEECYDLGGDFDDDEECDDVECDDNDDPEGCSPGYWKNHTEDWPAAYSPDMPFSDVFEDAFPGKSLLTVLQSNGGALKSLGRHTVAALLNAANDDVNYGLTPEEVISMFNAVYPGDNGDYKDLKDDFSEMNNEGCPL